MNQKLLALYGLKWNPFSPELPVDAIYVPPKIENFCWRIGHAQVREGGFAMIHGDPGSGKSIVLRLLAERLKKLPDITVGAINHPQSNMADFYRELGDIFAVSLKPSNRWGGFKALRERWFNPINPHNVALPQAVDHLQRKPMCSEPCFQCIPLPELSDEAVVEILDFLQVFTTDFENRYFGQIHRYYEDRSRHNIVQDNLNVATDDPPF
jgi:energy-coupling factor transporter ATP-binding protein EcfA2